MGVHDIWYEISVWILREKLKWREENLDYCVKWISSSNAIFLWIVCTPEHFAGSLSSALITSCSASERSVVFITDLLPFKSNSFLHLFTVDALIANQKIQIWGISMWRDQLHLILIPYSAAKHCKICLLSVNCLQWYFLSTSLNISSSACAKQAIEVWTLRAQVHLQRSNWFFPVGLPLKEEVAMLFGSKVSLLQVWQSKQMSVPCSADTMPRTFQWFHPQKLHPDHEQDPPQNPPWQPQGWLTEYFKYQSVHVLATWNSVLFSILNTSLLRSRASI